MIIKRKEAGMTQRDKTILDCLRKDHKGKHKAVHSKELEDRFNLCGRSLRRTIGRLRRERYPVCSCGEGYYYGTSQAEITETVCRLDELVIKISGAKTGLLRSALKRRR